MASKSLIPKTSGEGGIGIENVTWGEAFFDSGHFNKGLFVSGQNITQVIAETVTQGGPGGEWAKAANGADIYYNVGNVGIGTTTPDQMLSIKGDKSGFSISSEDYGNIVYMGRRALAHPDLGYFRLRNASATTVAIDSAGDSFFNGGNVGIGTTSPDTSLSIVGNFPEASDNGVLSSLEPISEITSKCLGGTQSTTSGFGGSIDFLSSNWYSETPLPTARIAAKINSKNGSNEGGSLVFSTVASAGGASNETITKSDYGERFTIKPNGVINISNVPTSAADLEVGDIYHDNGTLKIVTQ